MPARKDRNYGSLPATVHDAEHLGGAPPTRTIRRQVCVEADPLLGSERSSQNPHQPTRRNAFLVVTLAGILLLLMSVVVVSNASKRETSHLYQEVDMDASIGLLLKKTNRHSTRTSYGSSPSNLRKKTAAPNSRSPTDQIMTFFQLWQQGRCDTITSLTAADFEYHITAIGSQDDEENSEQAVMNLNKFIDSFCPQIGGQFVMDFEKEPNSNMGDHFGALRAFGSSFLYKDHSVAEGPCLVPFYVTLVTQLNDAGEIQLMRQLVHNSADYDAAAQECADRGYFGDGDDRRHRRVLKKNRKKKKKDKEEEEEEKEKERNREKEKEEEKEEEKGKGKKQVVQENNDNRDDDGRGNVDKSGKQETQEPEPEPEQEQPEPEPEPEPQKDEDREDHYQESEDQEEEDDDVEPDQEDDDDDVEPEFYTRKHNYAAEDDILRLPFYPAQQQTSENLETINMAKKILASLSSGNCVDLASQLSASFTFSDTLGVNQLDATGFVSKCVWDRDWEPFAFHPLVSAVHDHSVTLAGPTLKLLTTSSGDPCPIFASSSLLFTFENQGSKSLLSFTGGEAKLLSLYMMMDEPYFERYEKCHTNPPLTEPPVPGPASVPWSPTTESTVPSTNSSLLPIQLPSSWSSKISTTDINSMLCFALCLSLLIIILILTVNCCRGKQNETTTRTFHMKVHEDDSHSLTDPLTEDRNDASRGKNERPPIDSISEQSSFGPGRRRSERSTGAAKRFTNSYKDDGGWRNETPSRSHAGSSEFSPREVESFDQHYENRRARKLPPRVPSFNQHFETGQARKVPPRVQSFKQHYEKGCGKILPPRRTSRSFDENQSLGYEGKIPGVLESHSLDESVGKIRAPPSRAHSLYDQGASNVQKLPSRSRSFDPSHARNLPSRSNSFKQEHAMGQLAPIAGSFKQDQNGSHENRMPRRSNSFVQDHAVGQLPSQEMQVEAMQMEEYDELGDSMDGSPSGDILYQVFPRHIADALEVGEKIQPECHELVTVFFSDIVHFTDISSSVPPIKVSNMLDRLYLAFDALAHQHGVFKVETIGDAWMGVTNLDGTQDSTHAKAIAEFALDAVEAANNILIDEDDPKRGCVAIRCGLHSGQVVSNVIGLLNPRYCLFGDTVNVASRMESNSVSGKIQCSDFTAKLLAEQAPTMRLTRRGKISIKGKGEMITFFVGAALNERPNGDLLYQVFPRHIADALEAGEKVEPESHECVTVFFSDIVHFTDISGSISPIKVCNMLDRLYVAMDNLAKKHKVFKVETIGDAWMGVTNLDGNQNEDHVRSMAEFAIEAVEAAGKILIDEDNPDQGCVRIRAGFHSGHVVSNVIGSLNPRFCLFGDTVNVASRMESNSVSLKIQCSEQSAKLLEVQAPSIRLTKRGKISIKGKGEMTTFFVGAALKERPNEDLLYQVFPKHIADALDAGEKVEPESHECVTIFFSDIVHFTDISGSIPPIKVCNMLDRLYMAFDNLARKHNVFKVETIGDAWMGVTNLDGSQGTTHAKAIAEFAIDAVEAAGKILVDEDDPQHGYVSIRAGFHSGPVVSNVIGSLNPRYCLFGDTVNVASRMESNSVSLKIQCSEQSAKLLEVQAPSIRLTKRGKINIKGKGEMKTFFVGAAATQRPNEDLLYQVFPKHIADALDVGEKVEPESHECVTIFFSDIVHFTDISSSIPPIKVCKMLDRLYMALDDLARKHKVFKVETIGDAWMGVTNLDGSQDQDHVKAIAEFAIDAVNIAGATLIDEDNPKHGKIRIRVGFHSGPVVSNVVGSMNPRYCLFGDTVNVASRMESNSVSRKIQCSERSAKLLAKQAPQIKMTKRGKISIKGKGEMTTYFVGSSHELLADESSRHQISGGRREAPSPSLASRKQAPQSFARRGGTSPALEPTSPSFGSRKQPPSRVARRDHKVSALGSRGDPSSFGAPAFGTTKAYPGRLLDSSHSDDGFASPPRRAPQQGSRPSSLGPSDRRKKAGGLLDVSLPDRRSMTERKKGRLSAEQQPSDYPIKWKPRYDVGSDGLGSVVIRGEVKKCQCQKAHDGPCRCLSPNGHNGAA